MVIVCAVNAITPTMMAGRAVSTQAVALAPDDVGRNAKCVYARMVGWRKSSVPFCYSPREPYRGLSFPSCLILIDLGPRARAHARIYICIFICG